MNRQAVFPIKCLLAVGALIHKLSPKMNSFDVILDILLGFVCLAAQTAFNHSSLGISFDVLIKNGGRA